MWIEGWYNPRRRHSGLGQKSPRRGKNDLIDGPLPTVARELENLWAAEWRKR